MRVSVFDINHGKQIVLLPSSVRFEGAEAYVRKDPLTGDVVLSHKPESWNDFFEAANATDVPADFMSDGDTPRVTRDPFENWTESGAALKVLGQGTTEPTRRTASQCTGVLVALTEFASTTAFDELRQAVMERRLSFDVAVRAVLDVVLRCPIEPDRDRHHQ